MRAGLYSTRQKVGKNIGHWRRAPGTRSRAHQAGDVKMEGVEPGLGKRLGTKEQKRDLRQAIEILKKAHERAETVFERTEDGGNHGVGGP